MQVIFPDHRSEEEKKVYIADGDDQVISTPTRRNKGKRYSSTNYRSDFAQLNSSTNLQLSDNDYDSPSAFSNMYLAAPERSVSKGLLGPSLGGSFSTAVNHASA